MVTDCFIHWICDLKCRYFICFVLDSAISMNKDKCGFSNQVQMVITIGDLKQLLR
ncbi:hypothetical protein V6Z12_A12G130000 [Gossypium hirsutum]